MPERLAALLCLCALLAGALAPPPVAAAPARSEADARSELARVRARIREVTEGVQADAAKRDRLAAQLRDADEALAAARASLEEVRARRADSEQRRNALRTQQARARRDLDAELEALAGQLRAAYVGGREEQLKVLLNARDPATLGRMLAYYSYLGRARVERVDAIREQVAALEVLEQALAQEESRLAALEQERVRQVAVVDGARAERERALGELRARIARRDAELAQLRTEAQALEQLLERLRAALQEFAAVDGTRQPFASLRGRLPWPVRGRVTANYGQPRPGGLRWNGVLLETAPAAEVRAPYHGRVIYADWLPGLGLLLILDHGGGWLSLYGHNERLFRTVGDRVRPGDVLAASGGEARPELYFEIRQGTKPVDPRPWLRGAPQR